MAYKIVVTGWRSGSPAAEAGEETVESEVNLDRAPGTLVAAMDLDFPADNSAGVRMGLEYQFGNGVAVPHARLEGLSKTAIAVGLSKKGVDFDALDGAPVHHIFLVIASQDNADEYLAVMGRISRLIQDRDFRRFLREIVSTEETLALIEEMSG